MYAKKKFILGVTLMGLSLLLLISFTIAYFTDKVTVMNVLNIGGDGSTPAIKINVTEEAFASTSGISSSVSGEDTVYTLNNILANELINKDSTVTNEGTEAVYVRVALKDQTGNFVDLTATPYDGLDLTIRPDWVKIGNYYYYSVGGATTGTGSKLGPVGNTEGLPTSVAFFVEETDASSGSKYTIKVNSDVSDQGDATLKVCAEAIQAKGFTPDLSLSDPWHGEDPGAVTP